MNIRHATIAAALLAVASGAQAQVSNIDDANKYAWGENVGWIRVGSGPLDGVTYANTDSTDYGVNVEAGTGELSGYAWGENIGWVNFRGGAGATPGQPAMYLDYKGRLYGYAWGENVGWINLDNGDVHIGVYCFADFNSDGFVSGDDFDAFVERFEAGDSSADINGDTFVSGDDFDAFVAAFEAGC